MSVKRNEHFHLFFLFDYANIEFFIVIRTYKGVVFIKKRIIESVFVKNRVKQ